MLPHFKTYCGILLEYMTKMFKERHSLPCRWGIPVWRRAWGIPGKSKMYPLQGPAENDIWQIWLVEYYYQLCIVKSFEQYRMTKDEKQWAANIFRCLGSGSNTSGEGHISIHCGGTAADHYVKKLWYFFFSTLTLVFWGLDSVHWGCFHRYGSSM